MFPLKNQHVALISVHGDPAIEIGKEEAGGQNVYVRQVGEALARQGWQVDMFTRQSSANQPTIVEHAPNCRTIRLVAGPEDFVPRDEIFEFLPEFVQKFLDFQQESGIEYSVVHTNYWLSSWVGMELKKRQKIQQVHTYHSLGAVKYKSISTIPLIASTRLATEKACLETAERIVATSPQEREHMRSLVSTRGKIDIIPCGTDIHRFGSISQLEARQKLGIDPDSKVVFYVGRFDPRKGIETLVRAVGRSKLRGQADLKLVIGGGSRPGQSDGMERDRIEGIVNELGLSEMTTFPGRLGDDTLPTYYAAADVCVVPSHYEPFGLVAIEAMASGTPVIASDVGGLQFTVVPEETGLLAPPQDDVAFAEAIDRVLKDAAWRNQLGVAARKRVETYFSWEGVASQLSELYQKLMSQPAEKQLQKVGA
ncbi:MAG TPA: glycosyltransferase family 1 protein [Candidatus Obscuribacterales bacterium]